MPTDNQALAAALLRAAGYAEHPMNPPVTERVRAGVVTAMWRDCATAQADAAILAGEIERLRHELAILHVNIAAALADIETTDADAIKRVGNTLFALARRRDTPSRIADAAQDGAR